MHTHTHMRTHPSPEGTPRTSASAGPKALSFGTVPHLWFVTSVGSLGSGNKPGSFGGLSPTCQEADRKFAEFLSTPASPTGRVAHMAKLSLAKSQVLGYKTGEDGDPWVSQ